MNNSEQAKKGFKTFVVTLSLSLLVFSVLYYIITDSSKEVDLDKELSSAPVVSNTKESSELSVLGASTSSSMPGSAAVVSTTSPTVAGTSTTSSSSAFGTLATTKSSAQATVVLSGSDQSTESTSSVPETGSESITYALIISSCILGFGAFLYFSGPRKMAMAQFEKEVLKDLE